MAVLRMDNVAIVVDDLQVGIDFFSAIGLELQGSAEIEGPWADQTVGLNGVRSKIAMMVTPDGHSKVELTEYVAPPGRRLNTEPAAGEHDWAASTHVHRGRH